MPAGNAATAVRPVIKTMRAATIDGPRRVQIEHLVVPEPGPGEVRIRLEGSGVCGSNLPLWEGRPWFHYPISPGAPGHEGWGVVDAIGPEVAGLTVGDRVTALTYQAYAEYDIASATEVVPLPENLAGQPFPGEPLGCAMNILRRSEIRSGHTVAIIGIGFLGALLTRLASLAGARVIAISRRPFALEMARELGAELTLSLDDPAEVVGQVQRLTGGEGADRVIEVVGMQAPLDLAGDLTRIRGRLVIAGYHQDGVRQINMQLWNWKGLDVINAHEREPAAYIEGMKEAVEWMDSERLDLSRLYTHTFPLEALDQAYETMRVRPDGFLKALVVA